MESEQERVAVAAEAFLLALFARICNIILDRFIYGSLSYNYMSYHAAKIRVLFQLKPCQSIVVLKHTFCPKANILHIFDCLIMVGQPKYYTDQK